MARDGLNETWKKLLERIQETSAAHGDGTWWTWRLIRPLTSAQEQASETPGLEAFASPISEVGVSLGTLTVSTCQCIGFTWRRFEAGTVATDRGHGHGHGRVVARLVHSEAIHTARQSHSNEASGRSHPRTSQSTTRAEL